MQKVVGFFSKPENLFVLTLLIGLFTGTYKVVSKASNHNNGFIISVFLSGVPKYTAARLPRRVGN